MDTVAQRWIETLRRGAAPPRELSLARGAAGGHVLGDDTLRAQRVTIHEVRPYRPSLEDLFMQAVTDPTTGRAFAPGAASSGKPKKGASS